MNAAQFAIVKERLIAVKPVVMVRQGFAVMVTVPADILAINVRQEPTRQQMK
jgi:hypothetical protein